MRRIRNLLVAVVAVIALPPVPEATAGSPLCGGEPVTISAVPGVPTVGTAGPDVILGTDGPDEIDGGDGDDIICGEDGRDRIRGENGDDLVYGGRGRDIIWGGLGDDTLRGDNGYDRIIGGPGDDRAVGGAGNDRITGANGIDLAVGGPGADTCDTAETEVSCLLGLQAVEVATLPDGHNAGVAVSPPGDSRLFLVDQTGPIWEVGPDGIEATPLITLAGRISTNSEQGVLGLAFHPDYADNGRFFVFSTQTDYDIVIEEFVDDGDWPIDPADGSIVIEIDHSCCTAANHNGGMVLFGEDGYLYASVGDGALQTNGQNTANLLGTVIRIDIDGGTPYAIPADNPFVGVAGADEIWAYGLRNPWRIAIDPIDDVLYVADVGQGAREEIDAIPLSQAGANFGWRTLEGSLCFNPPTGCSTAGTVLPIHEEAHGDGDGTVAIVGGFVYRGSAIPELDGHYFYSDYNGAYLRTLRWDGALVRELTEWLDLSPLQITSFGMDAGGELYVATKPAGPGPRVLYRLDPIR